MKHNHPVRVPGRVKAAIAAVAVIAAATVGGVAASAGTSDPTRHASSDGIWACVSRDGHSKILNGAVHRGTAPTGGNCPAGYSLYVFDAAAGGAKGDKGDPGEPGPKGDPGADAPPPTVTTIDHEGATLTHIGGSWNAGHISLGSTDLPAGTYIVSVTGDFYKEAHSAATPVLQIQVNGLPQQVTAYTGAFPADPAEGVGLAGDGSPNGLEQTASAYATVVVPAAGATADVDAFGYNPDRSGAGSGDFGVIAHATFTKVG